MLARRGCANMTSPQSSSTPGSGGPGGARAAGCSVGRRWTMGASSSPCLAPRRLDGRRRCGDGCPPAPLPPSLLTVWALCGAALHPRSANQARSGTMGSPAPVIEESGERVTRTLQSQDIAATVIAAFGLARGVGDFGRLGVRAPRRCGAPRLRFAPADVDAARTRLLYRRPALRTNLATALDDAVAALVAASICPCSVCALPSLSSVMPATRRALSSSFAASGLT